MLLKNLKDITLYKVKSRSKQANGTYIYEYEKVNDYKITPQELSDEISADIYGASINNMLRVASPLKDLESLLYSKVKCKQKNAQKHHIHWFNIGQYHEMQESVRQIAFFCCIFIF